MIADFKKELCHYFPRNELTKFFFNMQIIALHKLSSNIPKQMKPFILTVQYINGLSFLLLSILLSLFILADRQHPTSFFTITRYAIYLRSPFLYNKCKLTLIYSLLPFVLV